MGVSAVPVLFQPRPMLLWLLLCVCIPVSVRSLLCLPCDPQKCKAVDCGGRRVVKDVCECCDVCSHKEGEKCGGLFMLLGRCDRGLECLPDNKNGRPGTIVPDIGTCVRGGCQNFSCVLVHGRCECSSRDQCVDLSKDQDPNTYNSRQACELERRNKLIPEQTQPSTTTDSIDAEPLDCSKSICPKPQLDCPNDSFLKLDHQVSPSHCCPNVMNCVCDLEMCSRPPPSCLPHQELQMLAAGTAEPGNCCDQHHCVDIQDKLVHEYQQDQDDEHIKEASFLLKEQEKEECRDQDGQSRREGDGWMPDPCTVCRCRAGRTECHTETCPVSCHRARTIPGQCCPVCDECAIPCTHGYQTDSVGATTCECLPKDMEISASSRIEDTSRCDHLPECLLHCHRGRKLDFATGCEKCECVECAPLLDCEIDCKYGLELDDEHCPVCRCNFSEVLSTPPVILTPSPATPPLPSSRRPIPTLPSSSHLKPELTSSSPPISTETTSSPPNPILRSRPGFNIEFGSSTSNEHIEDKRIAQSTELNYEHSSKIYITEKSDKSPLQPTDKGFISIETTSQQNHRDLHNLEHVSASTSTVSIGSYNKYQQQKNNNPKTQTDSALVASDKVSQLNAYISEIERANYEEKSREEWTTDSLYLVEDRTSSSYTESKEESTYLLDHTAVETSSESDSNPRAEQYSTTSKFDNDDRKPSDTKTNILSKNTDSLNLIADVTLSPSEYKSFSKSPESSDEFYGVLVNSGITIEPAERPSETTTTGSSYISTPSSSQTTVHGITESAAGPEPFTTSVSETVKNFNPRCVSNDGEMFWRNGCHNCTCNNGIEMCSALKCIHNSREKCQRKVINENCHDTEQVHCDTLSAVIKKSDRCVNCHCHHGNVQCHAKYRCPPTPCELPILESGECCATCPKSHEPPLEKVTKCRIDGANVASGQVWRMSECHSCVCDNGRKKCYTTTCPESNCSRPVFLANLCCPICLDLKRKEALISPSNLAVNYDPSPRVIASTSDHSTVLPYIIPFSLAVFISFLLLLILASLLYWYQQRRGRRSHVPLQHSSRSSSTTRQSSSPSHSLSLSEELTPLSSHSYWQRRIEHQERRKEDRQTVGSNSAGDEEVITSLIHQ